MKQKIKHMPLKCILSATEVLCKIRSERKTLVLGLDALVIKIFYKERDGVGPVDNRPSTN